MKEPGAATGPGARESARAEPEARGSSATESGPLHRGPLHRDALHRDALARRYGRRAPRRVGLVIITLAAAITVGAHIAITVRDATAWGSTMPAAIGVLLWAGLMMLADQRAGRPRTFLLLAAAAMVVIVCAPFATVLLDIVRDPQWIPLMVVLGLFGYVMIVPALATLVVTCLWFARTWSSA